MNTVTAKPQTLQGNLRNLPSAIVELTSLPNWVLWKWEKPKDKWTKVPYRPNGEKAKSSDSSTWSTYGDVIAAVGNGFDGIGFCLLNSELAAFDLDKCRDPDSGVIHPWALQMVERAQSYTEVTVSGTGLRIIGTAAGSPFHRKIPVTDGVSVEVYRRPTTGRYIVVTANPLAGASARLANIDAVADEVVTELDAKNKKAKPASATNSGSPDLPPMLMALLCVPDAGKGKPHGGYASRNEFAFAFITSALRHKVKDEAIIAACLDTAHSGCAIFNHCAEDGGRSYVERQIEQAKAKVGELKADMTDLGNARRLVRLCGEDIRYVHAWSSWLVWQDNHWRRDDDEAITRIAKATVEQMHVDAMSTSDEAMRTMLRKHAIKSQSANAIAAMVKLARSELEVILPVKKLDADPYLLGVENGAVDLRTLRFRPVRRDDYVTKRAGTVFDARSECPNWIAFMNKIFPDDALIKYVQRVTGYTLTGLTSEEVMFVLWGLGKNGKSTFREIIYALLGDYAVGSDASLLISRKNAEGATPDLARLHGRRLVTVNETAKNDFLNEARVKFITGHDVITARRLYEDPFDFTPTHKTFLTTNHKPIVRGTDEGIWRRLHLIPFLITIPENERDPLFRQNKLMPELSGILNWALAGLSDYKRVGLDPPPSLLNATAEYRSDMDIVGLWIEEQCKLGRGFETASVTLYENYAQWSKREIGFAMSSIAFGRELASRGFEKIKVSSARGFRGLKVEPPM
jgi:putative DNA primase/helicase